MSAGLGIGMRRPPGNMALGRDRRVRRGSGLVLTCALAAESSADSASQG